jgi:hypothetical protein
MISAGIANSGDDRGWYVVPIPPEWIRREWEDEIEGDDLPRTRAAEVEDVDAFVDRYGVDALIAYLDGRLRRDDGYDGQQPAAVDLDVPQLILVKGGEHAA